MNPRRWATLAVGLTLAVIVGLLVWQPWEEDQSAGPVTPSTSTTTSTTAAVEGSPGAPGVGDPYYASLGNGGFDVEHYTLDLTWLADRGVLEGVTTIEATATQDLSQFDLDLSGLEVRAVTVAGEAATSTRQGRELVVEPATDIAEGDEFTTVVTYRGEPEPLTEGTDLADMGWHADGREVYVVSEPSGAETFFPVSNHPTDKATYTIRVTAAEDQTVAANGLLVAEDDTGHGTRSWTYEASDPMASYLVQIAIGDYELIDAGKVGDVTIRHAVHRSLGPEARSIVDSTPELIELLEEVYGPFPFEAYGLVVVEDALGFALETQTLTIIGSDFAGFGDDAQQILVHELAHQWVGNAVSPATWQDIWLNEGFATYAEWLWLERTSGVPAAESARRYEGADELDAPPPGDPGPDELFTRTVYFRGGMALQALREQVGDAEFFEILRTWVDDHRDSTASTEDLIALAEQVSGDELSALFDEWLFADELPELG
jgi:aminopeptidase N